MPVASLQPVTDPADERLADYVSLTDVALRSRQEPAKGLYIAESSTVLGRALAAGHRPRSVLLSPRWLPGPGTAARRAARRRHGGPGVRRRGARARGDHRVPRAPRGARRDAPAGPRAGGLPARRRPPRRRAGGHRRPHQRRGRLPVRRRARGGRRARDPAVRRPAVPAVRPRLDGDRLPGAVDPHRPVARRHLRAARGRVRHRRAGPVRRLDHARRAGRGPARPARAGARGRGARAQAA